MGKVKKCSLQRNLAYICVVILFLLTAFSWLCLIVSGITIGNYTSFNLYLPTWCSRSTEEQNGENELVQHVPLYENHHLIGHRTNRELLGSHEQRKTEGTEPAVPRGYKSILRWTKFYGKDWGVPDGPSIFRTLQCKEYRCALTDNKVHLDKSDAVLIHMRDIQSKTDLPRKRPINQPWIFYLLESPYHIGHQVSPYNGLFNWTSTYSPTSNIPSPYGAYKPFATQPQIPKYINSAPNYARGKTRLAAWFVTNCQTPNHRETYVAELQKYIKIDIYGNCGNMKCKEPTLCLDILKRKYKFYLAFENSNCRHYITEKFWLNALASHTVPVVMGAPRQDYDKVAPPHSFIHVDDFSSPRELARYMRLLHHDARLYNKYFNWRMQGTVQVYINFQPIRSRYWCDLCSALYNKTLQRRTHWDLGEWWSVDKQCRTV